MEEVCWRERERGGGEGGSGCETETGRSESHSISIEGDHIRRIMVFFVPNDFYGLFKFSTSP